MRLRYTNHAEERMAERFISRQDVQRCVDEYVESVIASGTERRRGDRYKGPARDGRMLKVWLVPNARPDAVRVVKSAAWED